MSEVFYISGLNGFRYTLETPTLDPNLNSLPADSDIDQQSYAAPIQQTDTAFPALVCLSDFPGMTLEFLTCDNKHIASPALVPTTSSIVNQTFLQYLATVDFSTFPTGRCYGRVKYDANLSATINGFVNELASPLIDGNLFVIVNGVEVITQLYTGSTTVKAVAGLAYLFNANSSTTPTPSGATNPRIRLTVTKTLNGVATIIYDHSEVQTPASNFSKGGILQPGAEYTVVVATEDTAVMVADIDIADTTVVVPNIISYISCPIDVQAKHPLTQLFQYQNSANTESVLFQPSNLILQMRIEANMIGGYEPGQKREDFEDQPYNPVLLNGFDFDYYVNSYAGYEIQIPDWRIKQLNLIWAKCDQVKIDYEFYVAVDDIKFERPDSTINRNAYNVNQKLQIVKGYQFGQLTAGTNPTGDLIVVRKTWPPKPPFANFITSFVINGVFTQWSTIDYFETVNPDLATFTLMMGTTLGGNDIYEGQIGTPNADASIELIETHRPLTGFNAPTLIYVTLPVGANIQFIIVYDQLDAAPVASPTGGAVGLPQGTIAWYKELAAGYFLRDWDISTGFGQVGSLYEGCQILDQAAGKVLVAWDRMNNDITNPGDSRGTPGVGGANQTGNVDNELTLDRDSLPNEGVALFTTDVNNTNGDIPQSPPYSAGGGPNNPNAYVARAATDGHPLSYEIRRGTSGVPTIGVSEPMGSGTAINIGNDGLIMLCYVVL